MATPGVSHAAVRQTESGCLALADISGYTSYLAGAELDHAQGVLEDLTDTVVRSLSPPMGRHRCPEPVTDSDDGWDAGRRVAHAIRLTVEPGPGGETGGEAPPPG